MKKDKKIHTNGDKVNKIIEFAEDSTNLRSKTYFHCGSLKR